VSFVFGSKVQVDSLNDSPGRPRWFYAGALLGVITPVALRSFEHVWMLGHVPPIVEWLFWPTSLLMNFAHSHSATITTTLSVVLIVANAALYGLLAFSLRMASIGVAILFLLIAWIFSPPSDVTLENRFGQYRNELEKLVRISSEDPQLVRIGPDFIETANGRKYSLSEAKNVLSPQRLDEYIHLFKVAGLADGIYRSAETGEILFSMHRVHKVDPVDTMFGYLYCPSVPEQKAAYLPCLNDGNSGERGSYEWKMLDSKWYFYKLSYPHQLE
jgi:hypothetical protein